jgi:hypothetical protein
MQKTTGRLVQHHFLPDLIEGALQERGIDRGERAQPVLAMPAAIAVRWLSQIPVSK